MAPTPSNQPGDRLHQHQIVECLPAERSAVTGFIRACLGGREDVHVFLQDARAQLLRCLPFASALILLVVVQSLAGSAAEAGQLLAGVAKVDITNREAGLVNDLLYAKALVLRNGDTTIAIVTVDAVAIGEIGFIGNDYLGKVRARIEQELDIKPAQVLINASHCHGIVCQDVAERTVEAVKQAAANLVPVKVGVGMGHENRIMENRRLRLKDGKEADIRRAYSVPRDEDVAAVGPVDPEIGILRLDRFDGSTLAVVYNFACHPIMGVPSGGNTADITGFASKAIEESLGGGAMAIFLQGCAGDIHPVLYKDVDHPADAEPLGNLLGLSTLKVVQTIDTKPDAPLRLIHEVVELPRADHTQRIYSLEAEQAALLQSLKGTTLNFKKFLPLIVKYQVFSDFPSGESHRYLHDELIEREDWKQLDDANRKHMQQYLDNIYVMEQLTRLQANLALLKKHQARNAAADKRTIDVEVLALRIGDFALVTHPGEPTVQIGLNLKQASPHEHTFVAGYTNGYIYYAPTAEQLKNAGAAQEDSDCLLAPEWQKIYESKALEMLKKL